MYVKIRIKGCLEVLTGLHIGTNGAFSAIGSVDSPVVRDSLERNLPMIPGSSLKGKMRSLLARQYNETLSKDLDMDDERLLRLFGGASKHRGGRLLFSDMVLSNADELMRRGVDSLTEVKFENTINRITAEANPRQIERVIRGSKFDFELMYEYSELKGQNEDDLLEDFQIISDGFKLLQYDYIGGSGSRGYGKVSFSQLTAEAVVGTLESDINGRINEMLMEVGDSSGV